MGLHRFPALPSPVMVRGDGVDRLSSHVHRGTTIEHTRAYNRRVVLDLLRRHGPLSRTDVSQRISLTLQGVSNIMRELEAEGLVVDVGRRSGQRGQPPIEFDVNPRGAFSIGLSLERDRVAGILIDAVGNILNKAERTARGLQPDEGLAAIVQIARELQATLGAADHARLSGFGVALPAVVDEASGRPLQMVSHPTWENVPVRDRLAAQLRHPVHVANDAILASLAERWFGSGRAFDNFFYILLSRGFGSSHILNGEPSGGIWGVSGRMGHIPVEPNGRHCPSCGETGCLSLYTSVNALIGSLADHGVQVGDLEELGALHAEGNEHVMEWLDSAARYLARGLVALENLVASEAILFGGSMPEPLLRDMSERVTRLYRGRPMKSIRSLPQLLDSRTGADGVALGAATLPFHLRFAPNYRLVLQQSVSDSTNA